MNKATIALMLAGASLFGQSAEVKTIRMRKEDIPTIHCSQGQVCELDFDDAEQIIERSIGDSKDWEANFPKNAAVKNHLIVKTKVEGKDNPVPQTSLHVFMASGNVYSFQVIDVSRTKTQPDLRVAIELVDADMKAAEQHPKYVPADSLKLLEEELERVKSQLAEVRVNSKEALSEQAGQVRLDFSKNLKPQYQFERNNPFHLEEIARMQDYTLFWFNHPSEVPSLYEIRDGVPSLIRAKYDDGLMIAPAPLKDGYLAVGKKQKTTFHWTGN